jgi:AraC family transcriptional regulator of adaptative response / DNA-3-methyladenine glycosylase II
LEDTQQMELDHEACYRAISTRDARFDGRIFIAVRTTRIYCRPICPARTPKRENVTFFATASAAQEAGYRPCLRCRPESSPDLGAWRAGYRPCLRCRPESSPDLGAWRGTSNTVSRALTPIGEGALDGEAVDALAERLGIGERQLRRLFRQHLGASPIAVAQTRRVLFGKQLIVETTMPMAEVALAAGFNSIRRFNATFQILYQRPPRELRRSKLIDGEQTGAEGITLKLPYAPPYDWDAIIDFLGARAISKELSGGHTRRIWSDTNGEALIEAFTIRGMAHGVPLATTGGETCGAPGAFFLDVGISSTHHIARFWRLHESLVEEPRAAAPVPVPIQISTDGPAFTIVGATAEGSLAEPPLAEEEWQTSYTLDPNTVIAAAFRAAGLPIPEVPKAPLGAAVGAAPGPIIAAALKAARLTRS